MKKTKVALICAVLTAVAVSVFVFTGVSAYSETDPLITLSYLEQIVVPEMKEEVTSFIETSFKDVRDDLAQELSNQIDSKLESVQPTVQASSNVTNSAVNSDEVSALSPANASYTLLELNKGQKIMAQSICEFIVRPGSKVVAISPFDSQGVADITNGVEVLNSQELSINAYCLIPRGGDGRGMEVVSEKAYIMIRGEYTVG